MTAFRMIDDGYPNMKKIMSGRKWVGRVVPHGEGGYFAVIRSSPPIEARGRTEKEAFENAASRALGFESAAEVRSHNSAARARKKALRAEFNETMRQVNSTGSFAPFFDLLDRKLK